jgi:hypothetical protein
MMHSAERRFLIKELVVVMVGYLYATVFFPVTSYKLDWGILNLIQNTYGINHITNKFHRNELEFTNEFIGNFHGKIGKLLTTTHTTIRHHMKTTTPMSSIGHLRHPKSKTQFTLVWPMATVELQRHKNSASVRGLASISLAWTSHIRNYWVIINWRSSLIIRTQWCRKCRNKAALSHIFGV